MESDASEIIIIIIIIIIITYRARGSLVPRNSMLQAGKQWVLFPIRSLHFPIDLILPAALQPWDRLSL
jgi:hypothetical protein